MLGPPDSDPEKYSLEWGLEARGLEATGAGCSPPNLLDVLRFLARHAVKYKAFRTVHVKCDVVFTSQLLKYSVFCNTPAPT